MARLTKQGMVIKVRECLVSAGKVAPEELQKEHSIH